MGARFLNGADLNGQKLTGVGTPTASTDAATKGYVDANAGGGSAPAYQDQLSAMHNVGAINMDPGAPNGSQGTAASTNFCLKFWTPRAFSSTLFIYGVNTASVAPTGYYAAAYDGTGTLISGSATADMSTAITTANTSVAFSWGTTITIPAGFFFVSWRQGTATTQPQYRTGGTTSTQTGNLGLGSSAVPGALAPRWGTSSNGWSGATPPATLGTIVADFRLWIAAVR